MRKTSIGVALESTQLIALVATLIVGRIRLLTVVTIIARESDHADSFSGKMSRVGLRGSSHFQKTDSLPAKFVGETRTPFREELQITFSILENIGSTGSNTVRSFRRWECQRN